MGEYASYKGHEIKIGTCNTMYYLRWNQRKSVIPLSGNVNPVTQVGELWFRVPRHEEDGIEAGAFPFHGYCGAKPIRFLLKKGNPKFANEVKQLAMESPGICQASNRDIGVVCNIPCYHGNTTELPKGMFYNGFAPHTMGVSAIGIRDGKAAALVCCVICERPFMVLSLEELVRYCEPFGDERDDLEYLLQTMLDIEASLWMDNKKHNIIISELLAGLFRKAA